MVEKEVTLGIARRLQAHLGGRAIDARLTRPDDRNLTLADRAAQARSTRAGIFLSLHASRPSGQRGAELWVHEQAAPSSEGLAQTLQQALRAVGPTDGVRYGRMAVLDPTHHATSTATCLVELDDLTDPEGERRLMDASEQDRIAAALSDGIGAFLGQRTLGADPERDWERASPAGRVDRRYGPGGEVEALILWNFAVDSASLKGEHTRELDGLASRVGATHRLAITGYASSTGGASENQSLSEQRARAVRNRLASSGVPQSNLYIDGEGENHPWVPNTTGENMAKNRRVEITLAMLAGHELGVPRHRPTAPPYHPGTTQPWDISPGSFGPPRTTEIAPYGPENVPFTSWGSKPLPGAAGLYVVHAPPSIATAKSDGRHMKVVVSNRGPGSITFALTSNHGEHTHHYLALGPGTSMTWIFTASSETEPAPWRFELDLQAAAQGATLELFGS
jgi:outer membrane protein OmpA-like peptidoglycan-associated protein